MIMAAVAGVLISLGAGRSLFLLTARRPVRADVLALDLTDDQLRLEQRSWLDDREGRHVLAKVAYRVNGREIRTDVKLFSLEGERPPRHPIIWFDPANPTRATASGLVLPMLALAAGFALVVVLSFA